MQNIISHQMSVFGDYSSIEPTLERMNVLANVPPELGITLLPSTANVINIPAIAHQGDITPPQIVQCISMVDKSQRWNIAVLPERIDVNFNQPSTESAESFEGITLKANSLLVKTMKDLDVNFWRMAVNCTIQFDDENDDKAKGLYHLLANPMQHQKGRDSVEWQIMANCPHEVEFADSHNELVNFITRIEKQSIPMTPWPFVMAHLDINTSAQNREFRFDFDSLGSFYKAAEDMADNFIKDIEEKWKNA